MSTQQLGRLDNESAAGETESVYRVLLPIDRNERSALAQARYVGSLPVVPGDVVVTLTHVLHGEELDVPRVLQSAQRVGAVKRAAEWLDEHGFGTEIRDVEHSYPPTKGIVGLADKIDADSIVLSGRKRSTIESALFGSVVQSVIENTSRPVVIVDSEDA